MVSILVGALVLQFGQHRYVPWSYWLAVVLISIVGTLINDNLVDNLGVSLVTTTVFFSAARSKWLGSRAIMEFDWHQSLVGKSGYSKRASCEIEE